MHLPSVIHTSSLYALAFTLAFTLGPAAPVAPASEPPVPPLQGPAANPVQSPGKNAGKNSEQDAERLQWKPLPDLADALGVAGPFVGVHNDAVIVAGGANFPQPVWDSSKIWRDPIWVLAQSAAGYQWVRGGTLPKALAYGAAVSTPLGVVCMGGNDPRENQCDVFVLRWDPLQQQVTRSIYPPLPTKFACGQATCIENVIYVAGGQTGSQLNTAMNNFWSLDLSQQNQPAQFRWRELQPCPTLPRSFNITAHQHNGDQDCVYVIGGRRMVGDQVHFLKDVWEFNPQSESWRQRADLPHSVTAGTGIGFGQHKIFVLGGDDGTLFTKTDELKDGHPGFRKEALVYRTLTDTWASAGATPQNQVTTIPVIWRDRILIASGEIRPRVRTPQVWSIEQTDK